MQHSDCPPHGGNGSPRANQRESHGSSCQSSYHTWTVMCRMMSGWHLRMGWWAESGGGSPSRAGRRRPGAAGLSIDGLRWQRRPRPRRAPVRAGAAPRRARLCLAWACSWSMRAAGHPAEMAQASWLGARPPGPALPARGGAVPSLSRTDTARVLNLRRPGFTLQRRPGRERAGPGWPGWARRT